MMLAASLVAKATLVIGLALVGTRLARRSRASIRHTLLSAAFAVLLALPVASSVAPSLTVAVPITAQAAIEPLSIEAFIDTPLSSPPAESVAAAPPAWPPPRAPRLSSVLLTVWLAGSGLFLLPVALGLWQVRGLRQSGLPWREGQAIVNALLKEVGATRRVDVMLHETVPGPMTCGAVHPAIVLPLDARTWGQADLQRAILHELEHVRRGDWISHVAARIVCACYWFQPLVWVAQRQLSLEAERACDDAVLRRAEATAYADQLVTLAERLSAASTMPLVAMANRADLSARVRAVLDSGQRRGRAGVRWVTSVCVAAVLLVTAISPLRIVAGAQVANGTLGSTVIAGSGEAAAGQRFDVVTIRRCEPQAPPDGPGPRGRGSAAGNYGASPGRITATCASVEGLIHRAYAFFGEPLLNDTPEPRQDNPRVKGPAWIRSEQYTIEARAEGTPDRAVMMGPMLRAFLEERFKLKLHRETTDMKAYALTVAKGGLKIKPVREGDCVPVDPNVPNRMQQDGKPVCGSVRRGVTDGRRIIDVGSMRLDVLSGILNLDRPVLNHTGLTDEFNMHIEFVPDERTPALAARDDVPSDPAGPNVFRALEQQLGLRLEPITAPRGVIVVDHIEKPALDGDVNVASAGSRGRGRR